MLDICMYVRVCVFVKKIMLDLTLVTFFIRLSLSKTGKRGTANHPKSANLQIWVKYCSVSKNDGKIFALIGTLSFQYNTRNFYHISDIILPKPTISSLLKCRKGDTYANSKQTLLGKVNLPHIRFSTLQTITENS